MPTFDNNPLENLAIDPQSIDRTIDLGDASAEAALSQVDQVLATTAHGQCIRFSFSPPLGDGSETLFQPLGRHLLKARREGRLQRCLPASDGTAYIVIIGK